MTGLSPVPHDLIRHSGSLSVKSFGSKYKLIWCKSVREKGYELLGEIDKKQDMDGFSVPVNNEKLSNNVSRAKSKIFEYAFCNHWDYFITLTINPDKFDRYNLKDYIKALGRFINNYHTVHHSKISYLLIPEQHKDGAWHMHGLIAGILSRHLTINQNGYLDFTLYSKKFGYCSLSPLKSHLAVSKYITKYVTKELSALPYGQRLYYCSKGLCVSEVLYSFENVDPSSFEWDYIHPDGYCMTSLVDSLDVLENLTLLV